MVMLRHRFPEAWNPLPILGKRDGRLKADTLKDLVQIYVGTLAPSDSGLIRGDAAAQSFGRDLPPDDVDQIDEVRGPVAFRHGDGGPPRQHPDPLGMRDVQHLLLGHMDAEGHERPTAQQLPELGENDVINVKGAWPVVNGALSARQPDHQSRHYYGSEYRSACAA